MWTRWRVSCCPVATYTALANSSVRSNKKKPFGHFIFADGIRSPHQVLSLRLSPWPMEREAKLYICMAMAKSSRLLRNWKKDLNSSKVIPWNVKKHACQVIKLQKNEMNTLKLQISLIHKRFSSLSSVVSLCCRKWNSLPPNWITWWGTHRAVQQCLSVTHFKDMNYEEYEHLRVKIEEI